MLLELGGACPSAIQKNEKTGAEQTDNGPGCCGWDARRQIIF